MSDWQKYPHLNGLPIEDIHDAKIMLLIGQDNIHLTVARKVLSGPMNVPIATKTNLGWVIHGKINKSDDNESNFTYHMCHQVYTDEELDKLVRQSFSTDSFGISVPNIKPNKYDSRAMDILKSTSKRIGERFETGLLWRQDEVRLPDSTRMAMQRLVCVERKMQRNHEFAVWYCKKIDDYLAKGYVKKLTPQEAKVITPKTWYLPHFAVVNPHKPDKPRLVFDAGAESNGTSLNKNLLQGPDMVNSLISVLIKFRQYKIAFCGDIREMFHQIRIREADRHSQRFFWRGTEYNRNPDTYEMQAMIFGSTCSPCSAQYIKNLNAEEQTEDQTLLDAILNKFYVDDYLDSTNTDEDAINRIEKIITIQKAGGFEIVNWISNSKEEQSKLHCEENLLKNLNIDITENMERVLGLWWNPNTDDFGFQLKFNRVPEDLLDGKLRPTKRQVLSLVMSVYDPLGFLANFTIQGRILIQYIWRFGIGWDDEIPETVFQPWRKWLLALKHITEVKIPRCYSAKIPAADSIELHVFCDASEMAFAAAVYLRTESLNEIEVAFVMAKTRVAPLKPLSIARLELQAAVMGSRLASFVKKELQFQISKIYYWTDSKTVLCWIRGDGRNYLQFVAHRVGEIQELTDIGDWNYVPTDMNVADEATRISSNNLVDSKRWLMGPEFLKSSKNIWPTQQKLSEETNDELENLEMKTEFVALTVERDISIPDIRRFSKWSRLVRTTAWCHRFVNMCLAKIGKRNCIFSNELSVAEIEDAEKIWIKQSQKDVFGREISLLLNLKPIEGRLLRLSPQIDDNGLLRINGRTDRALHLKDDTKRPYILDPKHAYTRLLVLHYHEILGHHGFETIINEIRQKFWVIDVRAAVKYASNNCQRCKNHRARPIVPEMGQLPVERLTPGVRPFTFTGMDYFGPIFVSVGRRHEKRWGVLFTCLTVRAVHLEIAHSLTTDSAIMAIRRMASRRGMPRKIYSDNGTNFKGADQELQKALRELDQSLINTEMTKRRIEWHFIPPMAPHMGGCWERLIRSVKTALKATLHEQFPRSEVLETLFTEAENIVNRRPLTYVSIDAADPESLTPNHFLMGSSNGEPSPGIFNSRDLCLRKEWRKSQHYIDNFWKRWTKEFLPTLTRRPKWNRDAKPIKVNDVVLISEDNAPRNAWHIGKIERLFPGEDGKVRVADVKTKSTTYRRPISKLCRLDVCCEENPVLSPGGACCGSK